MFSKVLIKLIDRALVPAVLLLASRVVSVVLISKFLDLNFKITYNGFLFERAEDYIMVNSYSILSMIGLLMIGIFYVIIKSFFFHDSHIKPSTTSKLFSLNAQSLIQESFSLYTQGAVWLAYSYLLLIIGGIMTLLNLLYSWVFFIILGLTVFTSILLLTDIDEEIKVRKENKEEYDSDKSYLTDFEGNEGLE